MGNKVIDWNLDGSSVHDIAQGFDYQLIIKGICETEKQRMREVIAAQKLVCLPYSQVVEFQKQEISHLC